LTLSPQASRYSSTCRRNQQTTAKSVQPVPRDVRGRLVLALGEATGHAHAVSARDAELLADPVEVDRRFLRIATEAMLTHEEHAAIPLPPGLYRVVQQREYVPGSFRAVAD
jgi:hypothetical protein